VHSILRTQLLGRAQTTSVPYSTRSVAIETFVERSTVTSGTGAHADLLLTTHCSSAAEASSGRPVIFAFNGGPGAASGFLDTGFLGPWRIDLPDELRPPQHPPFGLVLNPDSPLDVADVVLIDPPGTGLHHVSATESGAEFLGLRADASAVLAAIVSWCERHERTNSPRYLLGESYGVIRAVAVLGSATGGPTSGGALVGFGFNGAILLGTSAHSGRMLTSELAYTLDISAMAATAHHHGVVAAGTSLAEHVERARDFEQQKLPRLLHLGFRLEGNELWEAAAELSSLIGVSTEVLAARRLRIDLATFSTSVLAATGRRVGIYDGRYTAALHTTGGDPVADDAAMGRYSAAFSWAMRTRLQELGVEGAADYRLVDFADVNGRWDWGSGPGVLKVPDSVTELAVVMERDPALRLLFATGYYDLATTLGAADYTAAHAAPPGRMTVRLYESGHMAYIGDAPRRRLADDVRAFISDAH
jgi:carboxypeptidase C (cathepsin A)